MTDITNLIEAPPITIPSSSSLTIKSAISFSSSTSASSSAKSSSCGPMTLELAT